MSSEKIVFLIDFSLPSYFVLIKEDTEEQFDTKYSDNFVHSK